MHLEDHWIKPLTDWVASELEPICEAEPPVLAKYVIALLRNDKDTMDLKAMCEDQLEDFLKTATSKFVESLFQSLKSRSFLQRDVDKEGDEGDSPSNEEDSRKRKSSRDPSPDSKRPRRSSIDPMPSSRGHSREREDPETEHMDNDRRSRSGRERGERERSRRERRSRERDITREPASMRERRPRERGHERDREVDRDHRRQPVKQALSPSKRQAGQHIDKSRQSSQPEAYNPDQPALQGGNARGVRASTKYNNRSRGMRTYPVHGGPRHPVYVRPPQHLMSMLHGPMRMAPGLHPGAMRHMALSQMHRMQRGSMARGLHTGLPPGPWGYPAPGPVPVSLGSNRQHNMPGQMQRGPIEMRAAGAVDIRLARQLRGAAEQHKGRRGGQRDAGKRNGQGEVHGQSTSDNNGNGSGAAPQSSVQPPPSANDGHSERGNHGNRSGGTQGGGGNRRGGLTARKQMRPRTTLLVVRIPPKALSMQKLSAHFGTFGTVVNLRLLPKQQQAIVEFGDHSSARRAIESPKPVLQNRFIQVRWARGGAHPRGTPAPAEIAGRAMTSSTKPRGEDHNNGMAGSTDRRAAASINTAGGGTTQTTPPAKRAPAAWSRQQVTVKQQKRAELLQRQRELRQQKIKLINMQIAHHKKSLARIDEAQKSGRAVPKAKAEKLTLMQGLISLMQSLKKEQASLSALLAAAQGRGRPKQQCVARKTTFSPRQAGAASENVTVNTHTVAADGGSSEDTAAMCGNETSEGNPADDAADSASTLKTQVDLIEAKLLKRTSATSSSGGGGSSSTSWWRGGRGRGNGGRRGGRSAWGGRHRHKVDNRPLALNWEDVPPECSAEEIVGHFALFVGKGAPPPTVTIIAKPAITGDGSTQESGSHARIVFSKRYQAEKAKAMAANYKGQPITLTWHTNGAGKATIAPPLPQTGGDGGDKGQEAPIVHSSGAGEGDSQIEVDFEEEED